MAEQPGPANVTGSAHKAKVATVAAGAASQSRALDPASPDSEYGSDLTYNPAATDQILMSHVVKRVASCPFGSVDWDQAGTPTACCIHRAKKDLKTLMTEPLPGIFFTVNERNLLFVHCMIVGNFDTPYEGGFFQFMVRFGPKYPFDPPRVCCMSSFRYGSELRFHPNMYNNGTVCLSLLGTWSGPAWSATNNLSSVLLSIQSLFTSEALCNEPGYEKYRNNQHKGVSSFDMYARHETLRVAVVETIRHAVAYNIPEELITVMRDMFFEYYDSYIHSCDEFSKYDGASLVIALLGEFNPNFKKIKKDLTTLFEELTAMKKVDAAGDCSSDGSQLSPPADPSTLSES